MEYNMQRTLLLILLLNISLYAKVPRALLDTPYQYQEQKKIYDAQSKKSVLKKPIYTETAAMPEHNTSNSTGACIPVKKIVLIDNTLLDKEEQTALFRPYLHHCNTLEHINNLVTQMNNLYTEKSYITTRAYIKAQKLSTGILTIHIMEGKIEEVIENNVSAGLVVGDVVDEHFHLRQIETYIEQLNRLQSKKVTMDVNPGIKVGYSKIVLNGEDVAFPINGFIGTDNYSYGNFKKFQINGSLEWENPLGIQDILKVNLNMTNKQEKTNNSIGSGASYGLPIRRAYLEVGFFKFDYSNLVEGLNKSHVSEGNSLEYYAKVDYKLFHTKYQRGKFDISYTHKKNENFLDTIQLDTTSNQFDVLKASYTHELIFSKWSLSSMVGYQKSLNGSYVNTEETNATDLLFEKVLFSLNGNVTLLEGAFPLRFSSSLYGQYGSKDMVASEQIGIGGPYSVRGFENKDQLSSNFGFYIRNEFVTSYRFNTKVALQPYLGLDYGWADKNEYSHGGTVAGAAFGARFEVYGLNVDVFISRALKDSTKVSYLENGDKVIKKLDGFTGVSISYRF